MIAALMSAVAEYRKASAALLVAQARARGVADGPCSLVVPLPSEWGEEFIAAFNAFKAVEAAHDAALAGEKPE